MSSLDSKKAQVVFHGTPHDFEEFKLDHIGTGEGAQSYGYGLYFTDTAAIADYYREMNSGKSEIPTETLVEMLTRANGGTPLPHSDYAIRGILRQERANPKEAPLVVARKSQYADISLRQFPIEALVEIVDAIRAHGKGLTYEVSIPDGPYLLWDAPLSQQPKPIQDYMEEILNEGRTLPLSIKERESQRGGILTGEDAYRRLGTSLVGQWESLGSRSKADRAASEYLLEVGIRGIKYLDGNSRNILDSDAKSYNYVIFDDQDVKIVKKNKIANWLREAALNPWCGRDLHLPPSRDFSVYQCKE